MKYRKSVFIVAYSIEKNKIYYLVLKRKLHWRGWEFPKGGKKLFETYKMAVKREVFEETGQKPLKIIKFNKKGIYDYDKILKDRPKVIGQNFKLYAVEIEKKKIKRDINEHSHSKWLSFKKALEILTWENQRECLKVVDNFLMDEKKR